MEPSHLRDLYQHRFSERERKARRAVWEALCETFFSRYVKPTDTVLDLGAGLCDFINAIECGEKHALDLSPELKSLANADVNAVEGDALRLAEYGFPPLDVVFASNVFEHVETKAMLGEILKNVLQALRPGGSLIITQPNLRYVGGKYWDYLDHHIPLTHVSMSEVLLVTGFELLEVRPRFLPYTSKSLLPQHPALVKLYLRFRPAQWLLGQQMFVVARRPLNS